MGQLLDLANYPLTTAQPGKALGAPTTAAARVDQFLAPDGTWKYQPGALLAGNGSIGVGLSNPGATETSLLTAAIAAGFPAGIAPGDRVVISAAGKYVGNVAATSQIFTVNIKSGSTQLATFPGGNHAASSSQRWFQFDAEIEYSVISGAGSMTTKGRLLIGGTGTGSQAFADFIGNDAAAVTVANNAAAALDLTGTFSVGTATSTASLNHLAVTYHPKNW